MVLLTSSAVSVIISSGIACTFTLALFLSGYVLQQKTVRSLQEAIRNPQPKEQYGPTPTLPPQFETQGERNVSAYIEGEPSIQFVSITDDATSRDGAQPSLRTSDSIGKDGFNAGQLSMKQLWHAYIAQNLPEGQSMPSPDINAGLETRTIVTHEKLAYLLIVNTPSDLCSALLFTKTQKHKTRLSPRPNIVFLYPATWETSIEPLYLAALDLLRKSQEIYSITLHPVTMSRFWVGVEIESQLLADLQLTRWTYDRAMFVRPRGTIIDVFAMDQMLALSSVSESWQGLPPTYRTTSRPDLLMYVHGLGLRAPRQDVMGLIAHVSPNSVVMADAKDAAYVILDSRSAGGAISERFKKETREICADTGLWDGNDSVVGSQGEPN